MISDKKIDFLNFLVESANKFREYEASNSVMRVTSNSSYDTDPIDLIKKDYYGTLSLELPNKDIKDEKELFIAYWGDHKFFYASSLEGLKIGFLIFSIIIMNYLGKYYTYTSIPYKYKNINKKELEELFYELFKKPIDSVIGVWNEYDPWENILTSDAPRLYYIKISNEE